MNRLFIKIKTDQRLKGTLLEVRSEDKVSEVIDQITNTMEGVPKADEHGQLFNYSFVRLGSPKRILENDQTLAKENIKNSDVVLLSTDPESVMRQGLFDFEPLSIENQYVSVQDLRAPIRVSLRRISSGRNFTTKNVSNQSVSSTSAQVVAASNAIKETKQGESPFEFQPLDIDLTEKATKEQNVRQRSQKASQHKKKKNNASL